MNSGNPDPADELSLIINVKRNQHCHTLEVVSEASAWLKSQLYGANVDFVYTPCTPDNYGGFSMFTVVKFSSQGSKLALELKVAEINHRPYVFADVQQVGNVQERLFPFFADISSHESKQNLLHYVSDFLLI